MATLIFIIMNFLNNEHQTACILKHYLSLKAILRYYRQLVFELYLRAAFTSSSHKGVYVLLCSGKIKHLQDFSRIAKVCEQICQDSQIGFLQQQSATLKAFPFFRPYLLTTNLIKFCVDESQFAQSFSPRGRLF